MRLLTPGPASCLPSVLNALSTEMIHHRTPEFQSLYRDTVEGLKYIFETADGEIAILAGSGTTGLEAGMMNAFQKQDQVLIIECGYFGERLVNIAKVHELDVIRLTYDWKETYQIEDVKQVIAAHPNLRGILLVYSETSTGALHDIQAIGELTKDTDILLLVDCISGLVMNPCKFDEWHLDIAVAASQKGFFLPPGLVFVCLSPKAMERVKQNKPRSYYLNLPLIIEKYHDEQKIGATPSVALLQGLRVALEILRAQSMEQWQEYYGELHRRILELLCRHGYQSYVNKTLSNALVVVALPKRNAFALRHHIYEQSGLLIEVGLGKESDAILRIGCMNAITMFDVLDLERALCCLDKQDQTQEIVEK